MSADKQNLIARVQKLFALADPANGATEAEAQTAMEKAQGLLALHKLSLSEVEEFVAEPVTEEATEHLGRKFCWKHIIMASAARLCFCETLRTGSGRCILIGKAADIATARELSRYLLVLGETTPKRSDDYEDARRRELGRQFLNSWRKGFAMRISQRVDELLAGQNEETAIIVHPMYNEARMANEAYLQENHPDVDCHSPVISASHSQGFKAGAEHGGRVVLSRQGTVGRSVAGKLSH